MIPIRLGEARQRRYVVPFETASATNKERRSTTRETAMVSVQPRSRLTSMKSPSRIVGVAPYLLTVPNPQPLLDAGHDDCGTRLGSARAARNTLTGKPERTLW